MSHTRLLYHIIFRTKYSVSAIDIQYEEELYRYIWGLIRNKKCVLYRIGGMPDHLHLSVELPGGICVSDFVRELKTSTGKWLKSNRHFPDFNGWGKRYAAFSYSIRDKERIVNYIASQKRHHAGVSLEEEIRGLLAQEGIEIDERYFMNDDKE